MNLDKVKLKLSKSLEVLRKYDWLLDSYVLDFYVDNHWNKLPKSWQTLLDGIRLEELCTLLDAESKCSSPNTVVWPLELLALRKLLTQLCLSRTEESKHNLPRCTLLEHPKLKYPLMKCVKPKKRHEIERMSAICARSCQQTNVNFVVDFGAGLGHLARVLGYGYGIKVCCLEMQNELNMQAEIIDKQLEAIAGKHMDPCEVQTFIRPTHLTLKLNAAMSSDEFLLYIKEALHLCNDNFSFGIIGLHPCGDLGATLMRIFLACKQAKFLNFVGCCYQKLSTSQCNVAKSTEMTVQHGYPMSMFLQKQRQQTIMLSHEAREISCHASEMYYDRLKTGDYMYLKVHSFRAAAERIIVKHYPSMRHLGLKSLKHTPDMQFSEYFYKAVQGTAISNLDSIHLKNSTTVSDLLNWRRIVVFYTLRLMMAPLIESIILYDRILFLLENDCDVDISAIFNPRMSPRNHITSAVKC